MYAYTYTAKECGLDKLPLGTLRLGGFEPTDNPHAADVFIVPCDIRHITNQQIYNLPYLQGHERQHALFCISDQPTRVLGIPAIIFRADCNKTIMEGDPSTISWPWPVNPTGDIDRFCHPPREGFKYDVTFVGWNSTPLTKQVCEACEGAGLKTYFSLASEFYGTWETQQRTELLEKKRFEFLNAMHNARLSLCARSIAVGVVRYRFYEAISMGRIPVHFNDGAYLPFQSKIDWDKCSIRIPEALAPHAGRLIREWLDCHSDQDILERGAYGRAMWETYLDGAKWDQLFGDCARERLSNGHD